MEKFKIWYAGDDESLFAVLKSNISGQGISVEHCIDIESMKPDEPDEYPNVILVDLDIEKAVSVLKNDSMRDITTAGGTITAFITRGSSLKAPIAALTSGYDLSWDAANKDYDLLVAILERELAKRHQNISAINRIADHVSTKQSIYNETIAALAEGAVDLLSLKEGLEKQNSELRLVRDELEQFVHTVSHDLKEPLMSVRTFTSMLVEDLGGISGDSVDHLRHIRNSVELMGRQIDSLLAFSRAGKTMENALVENIEGLIDGIVDARGYDRRDDVFINVAASLPSIQAAEQQVRQIFSNLISNGVKHNRSTSKEIEIGVMQKPPREISGNFDNGVIPPGYALFYISDNGYGIPGDDREVPFELFRRLVADDTTEGDGAGLAIVKRAVTSLGGTVDYITEVDKGTIMYFTLPVSQKPRISAKSKPGEAKRSVAQLKAALRR